MANLHKIKQDICEIGRRIYNKGFAAANDGNITFRISENEVLCTPTMICKGFMKPDDICTGRHGRQAARRHRKKRTSEVLLHLAIMKAAARREERGALPSAARHGVRRRPRADPAVRAAGGRGLPGRRADHQVRDARRPGVRRHDPAVRQEDATSSSWPITAR